jgi:CheY-like chemotaxis protein
VLASPGTLLVVEDNPELRELLLEFFEGAGFRVAGHRDALAAWEALDQTPRPCLLVLDLMMPRMTGYELLERLSARADAADFDVIVTSAFRLPAELAALPVVLGYLQKPVELPDLEALTDRWCQKVSASDCRATGRS